MIFYTKKASIKFSGKKNLFITFKNSDSDETLTIRLKENDLGMLIIGLKRGKEIVLHRQTETETKTVNMKKNDDGSYFMSASCRKNREKAPSFSSSSMITEGAVYTVIRYSESVLDEIIELEKEASIKNYDKDGNHDNSSDDDNRGNSADPRYPDRY